MEPLVIDYSITVWLSFKNKLGNFQRTQYNDKNNGYASYS